MTPTEIRLRLVQLRMRFIDRRPASSGDEKRLLAEIESLSRDLKKAEEGGRPRDAGEKRLARRIQVDVPCRYLVARDPDADEAPGRGAWEGARAGDLLNVSRGGILIATAERLDAKTVLWIQPRPSEPRQGARAPFAARCTVVRALPEGRRYLVGLAWLGVGDDEIERIAESLQVPIERPEGAVHRGVIVADDDRRRHPRHPVSVPVRFMIVALPPLDEREAKARVPVIGTKPGMTHNLSKGGLLLATDVAVMKGSTLSLEIAGRAASPSPLRARGVAVRVSDSRGRTHVGVRFIDPTEVDEHRLKEMLG